MMAVQTRGDTQMRDRANPATAAGQHKKPSPLISARPSRKRSRAGRGANASSGWPRVYARVHASIVRGSLRSLESQQQGERESPRDQRPERESGQRRGRDEECTRHAVDPPGAHRRHRDQPGGPGDGCGDEEAPAAASGNCHGPCDSNGENDRQRPARGERDRHGNGRNEVDRHDTIQVINTAGAEPAPRSEARAIRKECRSASRSRRLWAVRGKRRCPGSG